MCREDNNFRHLMGPPWNTPHANGSSLDQVLCVSQSGALRNRSISRNTGRAGIPTCCFADVSRAATAVQSVNLWPSWSYYLCQFEALSLSWQLLLLVSGVELGLTFALLDSSGEKLLASMLMVRIVNSAICNCATKFLVSKILQFPPLLHLKGKSNT